MLCSSSGPSVVILAQGAEDMKRLAVVLLVLVGMGLWVAPAYAIDDQNCSDFTYQEDAQAHLAQDPTDPDRLDADKDGIACETLPSKPASAVQPTVTTATTEPATTTTTTTEAATTTTRSVTTTTRVATSSTFPNTGSPAEPLAMAGAALLLGGGLVAYAARRTPSERRLAAQRLNEAQRRAFRQR